MLAALWMPASLSLLGACSDGASLGADLGEGGAGAAAGSPDRGAPTPTAGSTSVGGASGGSSGAVNTGATPSFGGSPTECFPTQRTAEDESVNAAALATAGDARPETLVPFILLLTDPAFDFSRLGTENAAERAAAIAEREAQLAPYQDPIEALLAAHDAENISSTWLINSVSASMPAQHVSKMVCWPEIRRIELTASYWDLVEPPWGPTEAGPGECPIVDGACPEHCVPLEGSRYDESNACHEPAELMACSRRETGGTLPVVSCSAHLDSGELYVFPLEPPFSPGFLGFRRCTNEEESKTVASPTCN
jgi:hypothetical protein